MPKTCSRHTCSRNREGHCLEATRADSRVTRQRKGLAKMAGEVSSMCAKETGHSGHTEGEWSIPERILGDSEGAAEEMSGISGP